VTTARRPENLLCPLLMPDMASIIIENGAGPGLRHRKPGR
jgi:hypothetical protein